MKMKRVWLSFDGDGQIFGADTSPEEAVERAEASGDSGQEIFVDDTLIEEPVVIMNPAPKDAPQKALRMTGLPVIPVDEMLTADGRWRMSLDDAFAALQPVLQHSAQGLRSRATGVKNAELGGFKTAKAFAETLLGTNSKLAKSLEGYFPPAVSHGLALLPHRDFDRPLWHFENTFAGDAYVERYSELVERIAPTLQNVADTYGRRNLCLYSTQECRATCLSWTGNNGQDLFNWLAKEVRVLALFAQPQAFIRLLGHTLDRYSAARTDNIKFYRMNVLSDIPWELICPWLFERYSVESTGDVSKSIFFYDYTKIPNRKSVHNYDLTFSFAGEPNKEAAIDELSRGRRVAAVFAAVKKSASGWSLVRGQADMDTGFSKVPVGQSILGHKIIDGDPYDMRPFDPISPLGSIGYDWDTCGIRERTGYSHISGSQPVVVGLSWKPPVRTRTEGSATVGRSEAAFRDSKFITPVYYTEASRGDIARHNPGIEGFLLAPQTQRHCGVALGTSKKDIGFWLKTRGQR